MGYCKAEDILPISLLTTIQEYVDGEYVYIPRKLCNKKAWGDVTQSKETTRKRNEEIYQNYLNGVSVKQLTEIYCLSDKAVYKVIATIKKTL